MSSLYRVKHFLAQTQMASIWRRDNDPLLTAKLALLANREETFNFLVQPADGLSATKLINRTCDSNALVNRYIGKGTD
ncbi:hypothetical protein D3C80_1091480 [compost metagenome]